MAQGKRNTCVVCEHPQRTAIDRAIMAGDSLRDIGTMFGTDKNAIKRHKDICMKRTLPALAAPAPVPAYKTPAELTATQMTARTVASRAEQLVSRMEEAFRSCEGTGNYDVLVKCAKEVREGLRLLAQLSGELSSPNQTNVQINNQVSLTTAPEWSVLVRVLAGHPEIRDELDAALREAEL
jgi:hypothetical protein